MPGARLPQPTAAASGQRRPTTAIRRRRTRRRLPPSRYLAEDAAVAACCRACRCAPSSARRPPNVCKFGHSPDGSHDRPGRFRHRRLRRLRSPGAAGRDAASISRWTPQSARTAIRSSASPSPTARTAARAAFPPAPLLGDPQSAGYRTFKAGVLELAALLPPNSHSEPTPADKDPVPEPFDSTYNVPEHDEFVTNVKYIRDDRFVYENMLDDATRERLDQAWNDLYVVLRLPRRLPAPAGQALQARSQGQAHRATGQGADSTPCPPKRASTSRRCAPITTPSWPPKPPPVRAISTTACSSPAAPGAGRSPRRKSRACAPSTTRP